MTPHLQNDVTRLENHAQLAEVAGALPNGQVVLGFDTNMPRWAFHGEAEEAGLNAGGRSGHGATFPAGRPVLSLDALACAEGRGTTVEISAKDVALTELASFDAETRSHASDHRPVVATFGFART